MSLARGNYGEAALSFGAMIPFVGWGATAAKFGLKYGDEALAVARHVDDVPSVSKASKLDAIPASGVAKYDKLAVESKYLTSLLKVLSLEGLGSTEMGRNNKMIFDYNPKTFNILDMRHEIQHFNQYKKFGKSMFENIPAMERGAYGFELRLGTRAGFNSEYMDWAASRLGDFGGQWP